LKTRKRQGRKIRSFFRNRRRVPELVLNYNRQNRSDRFLTLLTAVLRTRLAFVETGRGIMLSA